MNIIVCVCVLLPLLVVCDQPPPPPSGNRFGNKAQVHDTEHIREHLDGDADIDTSKMTNEQKQFHYFRMYDLDKNNMLDGIELIKAITHHHNGEGAPPSMSETQLEDSVDMVLKEYDLSNDGYIDFGEFASAQHKAREMNTNTQQPPN